MATVTFQGTNCSYIAHAAFTVSPDPYPNGIPCPAFQVKNISTGTKITIYASEVTPASGYDFPVSVYVNDVYVDYLQSTSVSFYPSDGMTVRLVATKKEEETYETGYVLIEREEGVAGYAYTYQLSGQPQSGSTTLENRTIYGDVGTDITITSFSYPDGKYSSPVKVIEYTDSNRTTVKTYWYWPTDTKIRIKSGYRYIGFEASLKTCTLTYASGGSGVSGLPASQTVEYGTYVTVSNATPTRAGYKFLGWSENAAAVVPDVYGGVGLVMYEDRTLYAIWEKNAIDRFYWNGSDANDAALIAKGQPVSNITAARWNRLLAKIKELADAVGVPFSYTTVSSGDGITAARFNVARTGLANIKSKMGASITIPDAQESGNTMYAKLFNGSTSIKGALNNLIIIYNSEL